MEQESPNTACRGGDQDKRLKKLQIMRDIIFDFKFSPTLSKDQILQYSDKGVSSIRKIVWFGGKEIYSFEANVDHIDGFKKLGFDDGKFNTNIFLTFGFEFSDGDKYVYTDASLDPSKQEELKSVVETTFDYQCILDLY